MLISVVVFFVQAEDGIRVGLVTGVQTCALPICSNSSAFREVALRDGGGRRRRPSPRAARRRRCAPSARRRRAGRPPARSEERRVGKERRCGSGASESKKTT